MAVISQPILERSYENKIISQPNNDNLNFQQTFIYGPPLISLPLWDRVAVIILYLTNKETEAQKFSDSAQGLALVTG